MVFRAVGAPVAATLVAIVVFLAAETSLANRNPRDTSVDIRGFAEVLLEGMRTVGYPTLLRHMDTESADELRLQFIHAIEMQGLLGESQAVIARQRRAVVSASDEQIISHISDGLHGSWQQYRRVEVALAAATSDSTGFVILEEFILDRRSDYYIHRPVPVVRRQGQWKVSLSPGLARGLMQMLLLYDGTLDL